MFLFITLFFHVIYIGCSLIYIQIFKKIYRLNRLKLNLSNTATILSQKERNDSLSALIISLLNLFLGSFSGAIASSVLNKSNLSDSMDTSQSILWLMGEVANNAGLLAAILLLVLVLEIASLAIISKRRTHQNDGNYLMHIYNSLAVGEIRLENDFSNSYLESLKDSWDEIVQGDEGIKELKGIGIFRFAGLDFKRDRLLPLVCVVGYAASAVADTIFFSVNSVGIFWISICLFIYSIIFLLIFYAMKYFEAYKISTKYRISKDFYKEYFKRIDILSKFVFKNERGCEINLFMDDSAKMQKNERLMLGCSQRIVEEDIVNISDRNYRKYWELVSRRLGFL